MTPTIPLVSVFLTILISSSSVHSRPSGSGQIATSPTENLPEKWEEHWFGHSQVITKVFVNEDIAVYFDDDVDRSITWPTTYLANVWRYVKTVYGNFGPETQLYAIFHTAKYSGGHPSTYFDDHHDYRNSIDVGSMATDAWTSGRGNDLDITTHEISHIVEIGSKGVLGSPAFPIWGDSKWAEIFNYDVYLNLGMTEDATRWYNAVINGHENFPRENTFWFRDWFYPIYNTYGGNKVLNNFFEVLAGNFRQKGSEYDGSLNMGEFVHFWSGAAGKNLKDLAQNAFGWSQEYQAQFDGARREFPNVNYT